MEDAPRCVLARPVANTSGNVEFLYNPYQVAFLEAIDAKTPAGTHAFQRLSLFAGRRGGKTKIGGLAGVRLAKRPGTMGWVCAPTYPDLHDFVMPAFFKCLPESWIKDWSAQFFTLWLKNGSTVAFRSLDDPERARGPGLDWAWIDETRKTSEVAWNTMLPALTDTGGQAFFTTSPNGYDWCYKRLYRPAMEQEPGFWACRYKTAENPSINPAEIARARRELDPLFFAQEYEADFVTFAGSIYGAAMAACVLTSREDIKRVLPEWPMIDPSRPCIVGMDPGADHPFGMVLLVATEKGLVWCGEYAERNKAAHQHVRGLYEMLARRSPGNPLTPLNIAIDKSQKQWMIELSQHGVYTLAAENAVVPGIQRVHSWLASGQFFIIEEAVPRGLEQMRNYKWAENQGTDGQTRREAVIKIDDDIPDALRYALMLWPELPDRDGQADSRRALEAVPEASRWQVERMRRVEARERGGDEDSTNVSPWLDDGDDDPRDGDTPFANFWN